jgi:hypothetical protein
MAHFVGIPFGQAGITNVQVRARNPIIAPHRAAFRPPDHEGGPESAPDTEPEGLPGRGAAFAPSQSLRLEIRRLDPCRDLEDCLEGGGVRVRGVAPEGGRRFAHPYLLTPQAEDRRSHVKQTVRLSYGSG